MENLPQTSYREEWIRFVKIIVLSVVGVSLAMTVMAYTIHNRVDLILSKVIKQNDFTDIKANIDQAKLGFFLKDDPVKLMFDPNKSFVTKTSGLVIFIEFNIFENQCKLISRVGGVWAYLDRLSNTNGPLPINIRTYVIDNDYCDALYGYGKIK